MKSTMTLMAATAAALLMAVLGTAPAVAEGVPDADAARQAMEPGMHTLTGRPGATRRQLKPGEARAKRGTERVYSKDEAVYVYPYTPYVEALVREVGGDPVRLSMFLGSVRELSARVQTDEEGYFTVRALQPGRYLLMTAVPYQAAGTIREDTGRTRTETTFSAGFGYTASASSVTSPIYRYRDAMLDLEKRIVKVVEVRADQKVTALGEIE